jgi:hypothetical protein
MMHGAMNVKIEKVVLDDTVDKRPLGIKANRK